MSTATQSPTVGKTSRYGLLLLLGLWLCRPCQICTVQCPSQAIRPTGEINANECHHCLDCQVTYWDAYKCPPVVERRKRFERRGQPFKQKL